jgi:hypothetical protein
MTKMTRARDGALNCIAVLAATLLLALPTQPG